MPDIFILLRAYLAFSGVDSEHIFQYGVLRLKSLFLLEAHWNLLLVDTSFSIVLWCWLRGSETHLVCYCWMMLWPTALLTSLIDAGIQRSICFLVVAAFANASAFSLPGIPTWAGTQTRVTFLPLSCSSEMMVRVLLIFRSK